MMSKISSQGYRMFTMRLKLGPERNKEWRCCLCLHVRTATILFGLWHLVLHVIALATLALIMRNHHVTIQREEDIHQNDFLPTPLSKVRDEDNPYYLPTTQEGRIYSSDIDMGALMTVCTLSITLLMVYGAIKGKATHLLPFFCLQMFDFAITTLTATGYFCYLRSAHRLITEHWNLPLRHELLQLSPQMLTLVVLVAFLFAMLWKAYWISVLWRCYKFLTLRQNSTRTAIHYIIPEPDRCPNENEYPAFFRESEGPFGGPFKQTPPPSYQDIMDDQPPPYPVSAEIVRETTSPAGTSTNITVNQVPSPSDASPTSVTSRVEADIEITSSSVENRIQNTPSTSQLKESTADQDTVTTTNADEGIAKTANLANNSQN